MNEPQKVLDRAFKTLAAIPVCGDYVDLMAMVREDLRMAYQMAGEGQEETNG